MKKDSAPRYRTFERGNISYTWLLPDAAIKDKKEKKGTKEGGGDKTKKKSKKEDGRDITDGEKSVQ